MVAFAMQVFKHVYADNLFGVSFVAFEVWITFRSFILWGDKKVFSYVFFWCYYDISFVFETVIQHLEFLPVEVLYE